MINTKSKYRNNLPQLYGGIFLMDGGMLTTFVFHEHLELKHCAVFVLLDTDEGRQRLKRYYEGYLDIAKKHEVGYILHTPTWRSSTEWGQKLGYSENQIKELNYRAVKFSCKIREKYENRASKIPIVVSACIGPRSDGYHSTEFMTAEEAEQYHLLQIKTFSETEADMVVAYTLNYVEEAIGIIRAAQSVNMPVVISFTLETDGKLPSGQSLKDAIEMADRETNYGALYYMIDCVHPIHLKDALDASESWIQRIRGLRANSSTKSHAELDECQALDEGNPEELGECYKNLLKKCPYMNVVGGCCGTDHRHAKKICKACKSISK